MRPGMPLGRAHATVGRSCERLRRAAGALGRRGADALVARGKAVVEAAQEAVSAASGRRVIAVGCDTGDDQSVRGMVLAVTDGLGGVDIPANAAAGRTPGRGGHRRLRRLGVLRANQRQGTRDRHYPASGCSATKDCWSSGAATASPSPGPRSAAPCSPRPGNWSG
jgi:hypothetical protein